MAVTGEIGQSVVSTDAAEPLMPPPPPDSEAAVDRLGSNASNVSTSAVFAANAGVEEGESPVVELCENRGGLEKVQGAAYYNPEDIEKYNGTTYVGLRYQVSSLSLIDSVTESFRIVLDLSFIYKIKDEEVAHHDPYRNKNVDFEDLVGDPKILTKPPVFEILNAIETPEISQGRITGIMQHFDHRANDGEGEWAWYVSSYIQIRVECYEEFEMHRFPFTRNSVQVFIELHQPIQKQMLVPYNSRSALPHFCYPPWMKPQEVVPVLQRGNSLKINKSVGNWEVEQHHAFFMPDYMLPVMPSGDKFSTCLITVQCKQAAQFFIYNTIVVLVFLPILSMLCIVEDVTSVADRMGIVLTLLLTMSTYKIVISDWIPQKDYLTLMDGYILIGFAVVLLVAIWVFFTAWVAEYYPVSKQALDSLETPLVIVLSIVWLLFNIWIIYKWMVSGFYKSWRDLLGDENKRLQEIAEAVMEERRLFYDEVELLQHDEPDLPKDDE